MQRGKKKPSLGISEIDTSLNLYVSQKKNGEDVKTGTQIWLECGRA